MRPKFTQAWEVTPAKARALQASLRDRVRATGGPARVTLVAGADCALDPKTRTGYGGVICYTYPGLEEVERAWASRPLTFPYVPGLLSFREGPVLLDAFAGLTTVPDVVLFDGQGIAHPRRFGIASHMGVLLDVPTIGCAKSRLCGRHGEPGPAVGDWTPLTDERDAGDVMGAVLRTREKVNPIFVSVGHRIDLEAAVKVVLACVDRTRIPKPTREADRWVGEVKVGRNRETSRKGPPGGGQGALF